MRWQIVGTLLSIVCLIATIIFLTRMRRRKVVHILDFQAGVRFDGTSSITLPPGIYFVDPSSDPITVVDMRPRQFFLGRQFYKDVLFSVLAMTVAGEMKVSDAPLALTAFKNLVSDSVSALREAVQTAISRTIVEDGVEWSQLASTLMSEVNRELQKHGIIVTELEILELALQHSVSTQSATAN